MAKPSKLDIIWATNGVSVDPGDDKFELGWEAEIPPYQYFNFYQNKVSQLLDHINTHGLPEWDALTVYTLGAKVLYLGIEYKCKTAGAFTSVPSELVNWYNVDSNQPTNTTDAPTFEDITITGMTGTVESRIEGNDSDITAVENRATALEGNRVVIGSNASLNSVNTGYGANNVLPAPVYFTPQSSKTGSFTFTTLSVGQTGYQFISTSASGTLTISPPSTGSYSYVRDSHDPSSVTLSYTYISNSWSSSHILRDGASMAIQYYRNS